jgi:hypothetical protein
VTPIEAICFRPAASHSGIGACNPASIQFEGMFVEILGSVERSSPEPRRNTSKEPSSDPGRGTKSGTKVPPLIPLHWDFGGFPGEEEPEVEPSFHFGDTDLQWQSDLRLLGPSGFGRQIETDAVFSFLDRNPCWRSQDQAVLSNEASTASGTSMSTNHALGYR